jgi:FRG domain-containing protein
VPATDSVATSVQEYVGIVSKLVNKWMPPQTEVLGPWFRGHSNAQWLLIPKLYRQEDQDRSTEDEIREEFITRAPSLTDAHPSNEWQWYFLMQHYSAPTRLLDWTDGGLIGLYFAVRGNRGRSDAAVWVLDPWWLNQRVLVPISTGLCRIWQNFQDVAAANAGMM